jgi:hypothetical protein
MKMFTFSPDHPPVRVCYTNYRNETAVRTIRPISQRFGSTEWHPEPQWLLKGIDIDGNKEREFALKDMLPIATAE